MGRWNGVHGRGAMKTMRRVKREEAEARHVQEAERQKKYDKITEDAEKRIAEDSEAEDMERQLQLTMEINHKMLSKIDPRFR